MNMIQTVYKDVFLTERYFIKGTVFPIHGRLTNYLDRQHGKFVNLQEALIIDLDDGSQNAVPSMLLAVDEVLFAHELVESGGDLYRKQQRPAFDLDYIKIILKGPQGVTLRGKVKPEVLDSKTYTQKFMVLQEPRMDGLPEALQCEVDLLGSLNYLIINRERIGYVFRY